MASSYQYGETDSLLPTTGYAGPRKSQSKKTCLLILAAFLGIAAAVVVILGTIYFFYDNDIYVQYRFKHAAVASDAGPCSDVGKVILQHHGGHAVDATIASLLCINLFNPHSAGIGGGNFFMFYDKAEQKIVFYDAREVAPLSAAKDMFEDEHGASKKGGLAIGVPGEIRGFWKAHQDHGRLPWKHLFNATIEMAQEGFKVSKELASAIMKNKEEIRNVTDLSELFFNSEGEPLEEGDIMYRPLLAQTLQRIADYGEDIFYNGSLAEDIVYEIQGNGGIVTLEDMNIYEVEQREPLSIRLADLDLYLPPPPGSGAVIALIMNILEGYDIKRVDIENNQLAILLYHRVVEAFKFSYAERSFLGDPEFVDVTEQVANMTSKEYAAVIQSLITDCCTHDVDYYFWDHEVSYTRDDHGTSHISIVDQDGNAVAATNSINGEFGSYVVGNRTGIIYNNHMDDFSMPYDTNVYNIPPPPENFIEPSKRPLSSMVPIIGIDSDGEAKIVIGASGGKKIITAVAQVMINTLWGKDNMKEGIERRRLHNQLISSTTCYEEDFKQIILQGLKDKGHNLTELHKSDFGFVQGIQLTDKGLLDTASDSRKGGIPAGY